MRERNQPEGEMAEIAADMAVEPSAKKKSKHLILALVAAAVLGAAGFYVAYSGLLSAGSSSNASVPSSNGGSNALTQPEVVFVTMEPLIVALGPAANARFLKFTGTLDVNSAASAEVTHLLPRIYDVLNTYLRAVSESELADPASMNRMRAQMLRRVQVVAGRENVHDLLITEFVLN